MVCFINAESLRRSGTRGSNRNMSAFVCTTVGGYRPTLSAFISIVDLRLKVYKEPLQIHLTWAILLLLLLQKMTMMMMSLKPCSHRRRRHETVLSRRLHDRSAVTAKTSRRCTFGFVEFLTQPKIRRIKFWPPNLKRCSIEAKFCIITQQCQRKN